MSAIEEMEKELINYGLTMEDIEPEGDEPKWLANWKQGKRLNTFEQGLKEQALREKQKTKEREIESESNAAITSNSENTSNDNINEAITNDSKTDSNSRVDTHTYSATDTESDSNNLINDNDEMDPDLDPLDGLFQEYPKKETTHTYRGFYLEKEVVKIIDKKSKKGGKGMKSKIVNEALKIVFKEKGWME